MGQIVTYLLVIQKFTNLKQKILKLYQLHYAQEIDNMKRTGFTGYVYDYSVDYDSTDVDDIKDIHKYLMKKSDIV